MNVLGLILCSLIIVLTVFAYLLKQNYNYWKKRNIPFDKPSLFYGSLKGLRKSVGIFDIFADIYHKYKGTGPFAGFFMLTTPSVVLFDLDLIKNVLVKDFNNFDDRGLFYNDRDDPLTAHLFALNNPKWRVLRAKLTPTFTSAKIKSMFPTITDVCQILVEELEAQIENNSEVEVREILCRYTTDIIGRCAFGIECNSLRNPATDFRKYGKKVFELEPHWMSFFTEAFPKLSKFLHMTRLPKDISSFFMSIVEQTVANREKMNIRRDDFLDLLIDLKNNKQTNLEQDKLTSLTMNEIAAQSFVFFLAGFETSSNVMTYALYELAHNQHIQSKLRHEINEVMSKYNGNFTQEGIQEMTYLHKVVSETLRKYPPIAALRRKAKAQYTTGYPKYVIPKNAYVIVPILEIQRDPEIYPNPDVFDPDRFTPEEELKRHPMTWLSFGDGPRNCIGTRFGKLETYMSLAVLVKSFNFFLTNDTPSPIQFNKKSFTLTPDREIVLKIVKVKKTF